MQPPAINTSSPLVLAFGFRSSAKTKVSSSSVPRTECHRAIPLAKNTAMPDNAPLLQPTYLPQYAFQNFPSVYEPQWCTDGQHTMQYPHSRTMEQSTLFALFTEDRWASCCSDPVYKSICNVEEALSPALMLARAGKSKFREMKQLFSAAGFTLKCYCYNHACGVIHMPVLFP